MLCTKKHSKGIVLAYNDARRSRGDYRADCHHAAVPAAVCREVPLMDGVLTEALPVFALSGASTHHEIHDER